MRLRHLTWMSVSAAIAISGCASRGNLDVLETALRSQEDQLTALQQQLVSARGELEVSQNEITQLRTQLAQAGQQAHSPEHLENEFKAVGLRFNSYLTSGVDRDGATGDELLSVLLYPHDEEGGLVKLAGTVELKAVDLSAPKGQHEIGHWTFTPAETKDAWHSGFLAAGFLFEEAWQSPPHGADVTLHARFTTIDGRQFDAVQPLRVKTSPPGGQPLAQKRAVPVQAIPVQSTSVQAGKPTVMVTSRDDQGGDSEIDFDADAAELEMLLREPDQPREAAVIEPAGIEPVAAESGVIETSDRYREWDTPTIR